MQNRIGKGLYDGGFLFSKNGPVFGKEFKRIIRGLRVGYMVEDILRNYPDEKIDWDNPIRNEVLKTESSVKYDTLTVNNADDFFRLNLIPDVLLGEREVVRQNVLIEMDIESIPLENNELVQTILYGQNYKLILRYNPEINIAAAYICQDNHVNILFVVNQKCYLATYGINGSLHSIVEYDKDYLKTNIYLLDYLYNSGYKCIGDSFYKSILPIKDFGEDSCLKIMHIPSMGYTSIALIDINLVKFLVKRGAAVKIHIINNTSNAVVQLGSTFYLINLDRREALVNNTVFSDVSIQHVQVNRTYYFAYSRGSRAVFEGANNE
jgi:hypothetical protein